MPEDKMIEYSGTFISEKYSPGAHPHSESIRIHLLSVFLQDNLANLLGVFKPFLRAGCCTIGNYDKTTLRIDVLRLPDDDFDRFCMAYALTRLSNNSELFNTSYHGWDGVRLIQHQLARFHPITLTFSHNVYEMLRRIGCASSTCADLRQEYEFQKKKDKDDESVWLHIGTYPDHYLANMFERTFEEMGIDSTTLSEATVVPMIRFEDFTRTLLADDVSRQALYIAFYTGVRRLTGTDPSLPTDIRCENLTRTNFYTPRKD